MESSDEDTYPIPALTIPDLQNEDDSDSVASLKKHLADFMLEVDECLDGMDRQLAAYVNKINDAVNAFADDVIQVKKDVIALNKQFDLVLKQK